MSVLVGQFLREINRLRGGLPAGGAEAQNCNNFNEKMGKPTQFWDVIKTLLGLGCQSRIRINYKPERNKLVITEFMPEHSHNGANDSTATLLESSINLRRESGNGFCAGNFFEIYIKYHAALKPMLWF